MTHAEAIFELNNKIAPLLRLEKHYEQMVEITKQSVLISTRELKRVRRDLKKFQSLLLQVENDIPIDKTTLK